MELPLAGLHQLCAPMLGAVEALRGPQRDALRVAFGLRDGGVPDRFLAALAALSLPAEVVEGVGWIKYQFAHGDADRARAVRVAPARANE